jgi:hypothetical protein
MSKKVLIDALFTQFTAFVNELSNMYPEDADFPMFAMTLSLMKSTNPMMVINFIKTEITDIYGEKIAVRDESFFLNQDLSTRDDVDLNVVDKLKQYIVGMTPATKDTVWAYIEIITRLSTKILSL